MPSNKVDATGLDSITMGWLISQFNW